MSYIGFPVQPIQVTYLRLVLQVRVEVSLVLSKSYDFDSNRQQKREKF